MKSGKETKIIYSINSAIKIMKKECKADEIICVTGSLYTVGEARKTLVHGNGKYW